MAVWSDGSYSIRHYEIANAETEEAWSNFFENMITKGLDDTYQNGQTVDLSVAKASRRQEIISDAYDIFEAPNYEEASIRLAEFQEKWKLIEPDAVRNFTRDIHLCLTFYQFDSSLHNHIRTTNHLERLFREFRTKTDEIGTFPHKTSCLTLFFLVMQRDHAKHRRLPMAKTS